MFATQVNRELMPFSKNTIEDTTMAFIWDNNLETGHNHIDNQHRMLFNTLQRLGSSCRDGSGHDELVRTVEFLNAYTLKHFADEEKLQVLHDYPDYQEHKRYHDDFSRVVRELSGQLLQEGASYSLVHTVYGTIGDWLLHHIKGEDFKMAAYMQRSVHARRNA